MVFGDFGVSFAATVAGLYFSLFDPLRCRLSVFFGQRGWCRQGRAGVG